MAGHVGLELRNVAANYPLERLHRFAESRPNSGHRDYARLRCAAGETPLGPCAAGIFSRRYTPMLTIERHRGDTLMAIAYGSVPLNIGNRTNDGASGCLVAQGGAVERT